jgi:hypothetical protein
MISLIAAVSYESVVVGPPRVFNGVHVPSPEHSHYAPVTMSKFDSMPQNPVGRLRKCITGDQYGNPVGGRLFLGLNLAV